MKTTIIKKTSMEYIHEYLDEYNDIVFSDLNCDELFEVHKILKYIRDFCESKLKRIHTEAFDRLEAKKLLGDE